MWNKTFCVKITRQLMNVTDRCSKRTDPVAWPPLMDPSVAFETLWELSLQIQAIHRRTLTFRQLISLSYATPKRKRSQKCIYFEPIFSFVSGINRVATTSFDGRIDEKTYNNLKFVTFSSRPPPEHPFLRIIRRFGPRQLRHCSHLPHASAPGSTFDVSDDSDSVYDNSKVWRLN